MDLEFPEIDTTAAPPADPKPVTAMAPAAAGALELSKLDLSKVALAGFSESEEQIKAAEAALKNVEHDLSTPTKLKDAISLRNRLVKVPRTQIGKLGDAIRARMRQVGKDVTAHEEKLAAEFDRVELYITPQIEARQAEIAADEKREGERKAGHIARIGGIAAMLNGAEDKSAERLANGVVIVDGLLMEGFEEYAAEAEATRTRVLLGLKALHQKAIDREAEEARRVEEQARIAREAAELAEAARVLAEGRAQLARERAELEALRAAQVPAPVPPAPAPEPAPADPIGDALAALPVLGTMVSRGGPGSGVFGFEPVVQDPPPVFDRAGDEFAEPHMQADPVRTQLSEIHARTVERDERLGLSQESETPEPATLKLGTICERFGPGFSITAAFVSDTLGIQPAGTERAAKLYRASDFARICDALVAHIGSVRGAQ